MITLKSDKPKKGFHVVTVDGMPKVFPTLVKALKYIAARY